MIGSRVRATSKMLEAPIVGIVTRRVSGGWFPWVVAIDRADKENAWLDLLMEDEVRFAASELEVIA